MRLLVALVFVAASVGYQLVNDKPTGCSKGPAPGVVAVSKVVMAATGFKSSGIYNCR